MATWLSKLLLLLSVLLMPLAMTPAAGAAPDHAAMGSAMGMEHCPDESSKPDVAPGIATCSMACAAALPAFAVTLGQKVPSRGVPAGTLEPGKLHGLDPESADPPPRTA